MPTDHRKRLASIRRFDQLVAYLRDELGWPIDSDDFEELTFEYAPEELGIDAKNAAKIQEIKRLRPLVTGQPWGIFFVKFEPMRLPVVALRRILGRVALKKRAAANLSERQAWAPDDLLFVSSYGEGDERRIAFAHFSTPGDGHDLPTLKVLGWDNLDTPLHLDSIARQLTGHLKWPDDEDPDTWRDGWRAAFTLRHREVITTSKQLSERLAALARAIRDRTQTALAIESESGPLTKLMNAFQIALVHDLDEAGFADMYAQTIAYGLLSARIADPARRSADDFAAHMRTNPFLRELMETFLRVGGRRGKADGAGIDFDELGISEVVELLDQAKMEAVVRDFGDQNPQEDPVIHFYERFLAAYDKKEKVRRGVFYTPRPVVSYIVRSVDELLRKEFGLADGLADTTTWGDLAERHKELKIPEGTSPAQTFVQILDPATGTGTFLVEVIDLIHSTMAAKWKSQGHATKKSQTLWNEYVPKHLLPRLHGYELLMAPYAIAHLKIGLKLFETGYSFESDERARVYLTNALEPASDFSGQLEFMIPALAHEVTSVNSVKRGQQFTVVLGNPPYAGISSNMQAVVRKIVDPYRYVDGVPIREKGALQFEKNLNDDYVKFVRFAESLIEHSAGVAGLIINNAYLESVTLRGLRSHLLDTFSLLRFLNLHGDVDMRETTADGMPDKNVFDIKHGVSIALMCLDFNSKRCGEKGSAYRLDLRGSRDDKYQWLSRECARSFQWILLQPRGDRYNFTVEDSGHAAEYESYVSVSDLFGVNSTGFESGRDEVLTAFTRKELKAKLHAFCRGPGRVVRKRFSVERGWGAVLFEARNDILVDPDFESRFRQFLFGPFDIRWCFYRKDLLKTNSFSAGKHLCYGPNRALVVMRQVSIDAPFTHVGVSEYMVNNRCFYSTKGKASYFPLYLYSGESDLVYRDGELLGTNLRHHKIGRFAEALGLEGVEEDVRGRLSAVDLFNFAYSVFHSSQYRQRYGNFLKVDFPRLPPTRNLDLFRALARLGAELVGFHIMESPKLTSPSFRTTYAGPNKSEVGRVGWSDGTVWLDADKTNARKGHRATRPGTVGFTGVPEQVWDFHIGGYQVCYKWLKDRKGRPLSDHDVAHYQKIVVALGETIRIMGAIDEVIEAHGGWPVAFQTGSEVGTASGGATMVIPFRPRTVEPAPEERYVTCVPLVPLRAAAGAFSDPQYIEDGNFEWVEVASIHRLRKGMFVAQVVGKSMEPTIPDAAWCLFRSPVEGTRQGKIVLVQLRDAIDPDTGQRYTIKRYKSQKAEEGDSWRHVKITLDPVNPDFEPIVVTGADDGEFQVVAELVEVLERRAFSAETISR